MFGWNNNCKEKRKKTQLEERLLMKVVEEHLRSNEQVMGQLLSGLSGILHQTCSTAPNMQTHPIPKHNNHTL